MYVPTTWILNFKSYSLVIVLWNKHNTNSYMYYVY